MVAGGKARPAHGWLVCVCVCSCVYASADNPPRRTTPRMPEETGRVGFPGCHFGALIDGWAALVGRQVASGLEALLVVVHSCSCGVSSVD